MELVGLSHRPPTAGASDYIAAVKVHQGVVTLLCYQQPPPAGEMDGGVDAVRQTLSVQMARRYNHWHRPTGRTAAVLPGAAGGELKV